MLEGMRGIPQPRGHKEPVVATAKELREQMQSLSRDVIEAVRTRWWDNYVVSPPLQ